MDKNRPPAPPHAENPIVILRSLTPGMELALHQELCAAHAAGDVDRAAKCVTAALSSTMKRDMVDAMVSLVNNLAYTASHYPPSLRVLLCKAADSGFHEYAYNAANHLMDDARSVNDYKEAERYFKMAMAFSEKPALQAAAYVNYCPIIRDGLISGTPDGPAAVELYETAARMGLVKAMFNAGNVSTWLANNGEPAYGARAAYWFNYALDVQASGKRTLDLETSGELVEVFEQCMLALSGLHIDAKFEGADLEEGIRLAKAVANRGNVQARHNLGIGYVNRLIGLTAPAQDSPGANWRSVLTQLDWKFKGEMRTIKVRLATSAQKDQPLLVDSLTVDLGDGSAIPLFVTHDPCLPALEGLDLISDIAHFLAERHPEGYFLVSRKAFFIEKHERSFTPIYVWHRGRFRRQALWMSGSPNIVLQHAAEGVDFLDPRFGSCTCMIPIAVNILDEGFVVATYADVNQPWISVGEPWRMPFLDENQLANVGLAISRQAP